jgi:hypothetical protein
MALADGLLHVSLAPPDGPYRPSLVPLTRGAADLYIAILMKDLKGKTLITDAATA